MGDSLLYPKFELEAWDVVLANPPWNQDGYNEEVLKKNEKYGLPRRLYELIRAKLGREDSLNYKWLSDIYAIYTKNLVGESEDERLARIYYARTLEAISRSLEVIERQAEFTPLEMGQELFDKFVQERALEVEEKASALIIGFSRFELYAKSEPAYIHVVDKIERLLMEWRSKLKESAELYEEVLRLWREIYSLREEFSKLQLTPLELLIYRTLMDAGFGKNLALSVARDINEKVRDKISVPGWIRNPKLAKDVEKDIAMAILRGAKLAKRRQEELRSLIGGLLEKVKTLEPK